ncbi:MAG TPA: pentapeptide repeat-containing protein, partial [Longimicrobium sp.]|nr:pentapeptide repeat-containing protein [Longimicrobium sp.]
MSVLDRIRETFAGGNGGPPAQASLSREEVERRLAAGDRGLAGVRLTGVDLSGMDLRNAMLAGAHLGDAVLKRSDLSGANLSGAELERADFMGAGKHGVPQVHPGQIHPGQPHARERAVSGRQPTLHLLTRQGRLRRRPSVSPGERLAD